MNCYPETTYSKEARPRKSEIISAANVFIMLHTHTGREGGTGWGEGEREISLAVILGGWEARALMYTRHMRR